MLQACSVVLVLICTTGIMASHFRGGIIMVRRNPDNTVSNLIKNTEYWNPIILVELLCCYLCLWFKSSIWCHNLLAVRCKYKNFAMLSN